MAWELQFNFYIKLNKEIAESKGCYPSPYDFCEQYSDNPEMFFCKDISEGPGDDIWMANYTPEGADAALLEAADRVSLENEGNDGFAVDITTGDWLGVKACYLQCPEYQHVLKALVDEYGEDAYTAHYGPIRIYW